MTSMRLILLFMQLKKLVVKLTHPCLITSLQTLPEIGLRRIKSFQRGTVGLCRSTGVKFEAVKVGGLRKILPLGPL